MKTRDALGKNGAKFWRNVIWGKIIGWHEWMHEMEDKEKKFESFGDSRINENDDLAICLEKNEGPLWMKHFMEIRSPKGKEWGLNHKKKSMNEELMAWEISRKL